MSSKKHKHSKKNKDPESRLKIISIMFFLGILAPFIILAIGYIASGYRSSGTRQEIDAHGTCKAVKNTGGTQYFVPTKSSAEWNAFLTEHPADVVIAECYTYSWKIGAYGGWSTSCGNATRTRPVECERDDLQIVADGFCTGAKPTTTENSNQGSTTCGWGAWGAYGSCSKTCGGGTKYSYRSCNVAGHCAGSNRRSASCNTQACCTPTTKVIYNGNGNCNTACSGTGGRYCSRQYNDNTGIQGSRWRFYSSCSYRVRGWSGDCGRSTFKNSCGNGYDRVSQGKATCTCSCP